MVKNRNYPIPKGSSDFQHFASVRGVIKLLKIECVGFLADANYAYEETKAD
jgi:hypothetical protein